MSAQLINWLGEIKSFLPWISFIAGVGGSLHCVGMCGGLVTASCEKSHDVFRYQIGRLIGYLFLGLAAGFLGNLLMIKNIHPFASFVTAFFVGGVFIFWGIQNLRNKKVALPVPRFVSKVYLVLWRKLVQKNKNFTKAFFTGMISIFLPCGLLYGVALGTVALEHTHEAIVAMFFFWLGTVPSMVVAPAVVRRLIRPIKLKLPKTYAVSLILIGVLTITFRTIKHYDLHSSLQQSENVKSCH